MVDFAMERISRGENGVILAPRGAAKSTWLNTILNAFLVATRPDIRIGLFSQKDKKAEAMSSAVRFAVSESEEFRELFGDLRSPVKWTDSEWLRKGSKWAASKDRTMVTGGVNNSSAVSKRFDYLCLDDVLDAENTYNIDRREKTEDWFWKTMKPAQAAEGVSILAIGCLGTGTPVLMGDGTWRPIERVRVGEQVWSVDDAGLDAGPRDVEAVLDQGVAQTFTVTTRASRVVATGHHPFLAWSEGPYGRKTRGGAPVWKRADELIAGDYLVEVKEVDGQNTHEWMTPDFCWLLGFLFGDGWLTKSDVVCCALGSNEAMNDRVLAALGDWFPTTAFRRTPFGYVRGDNKTVVGALRELGLSGTAKTKRLPEWLFAAPPAFRHQFLLGLCDADGTKTGISGMTDSRALELTNEGLIDDVRRLALTCGVRPGAITSRTRVGQAPNSPQPTTSTSWRIHLNFAYVGKPELGDGRARWTPTGDRRLGTRWRLAKVISVQPSGFQRVWDLTVEGTHTFIADGVAVHNTRWVEGDLYERLIDTNHWPALVIPAITKDAAGNDVSYWPEVWPLDRLYKEREDVGWDNFACSYLNDISGSREGVIFRREWWDPTGYFDELPRDRRFIHTMGVDLASSERERADFTTRVVVAEDEQHDHWVLSAVQVKIESGHAQFVKDGFAAYPAISKAIIETNQHQSTLVQDLLNTTSLPVVGRRADTEKRSRHRAVAARYESHRVHHHRSLKGGDLENQLTGYPHGHDDLIDALYLAMDIRGVSGAIAAVSGRPGASGAPTATLGSELRFVDGPAMVPAYLGALLDGLASDGTTRDEAIARLTRDEAIAAANRQQEMRFIRAAMGGWPRR